MRGGHEHSHTNRVRAEGETRRGTVSLWPASATQFKVILHYNEILSLKKKKLALQSKAGLNKKKEWIKAKIKVHTVWEAKVGF